MIEKVKINLPEVSLKLTWPMIALARRIVAAASLAACGHRQLACLKLMPAQRFWYCSENGLIGGGLGSEGYFQKRKEAGRSSSRLGAITEEKPLAQGLDLTWFSY